MSATGFEEGEEGEDGEKNNGNLTDMSWWLDGGSLEKSLILIDLIII